MSAFKKNEIQELLDIAVRFSINPRSEFNLVSGDRIVNDALDLFEKTAKLSGFDRTKDFGIRRRTVQYLRRYK